MSTVNQLKMVILNKIKEFEDWIMYFIIVMQMLYGISLYVAVAY